jgi:hypothetical protein
MVVNGQIFTKLALARKLLQRNRKSKFPKIRQNYGLRMEGKMSGRRAREEVLIFLHVVRNA